MARLFDGTSYALASSVTGSSELVVKRAGQSEIERVTVATLAAAVGGTLISGVDGIDGADGIFITKTVIDDVNERLDELEIELRSRIGSNEANLSNIYTTHATNVYVLSQSELTRQASTADSQAYVNSTLTAYATKAEALATKAETLNAAIGAASAAITDSLTSYATQAFATAQATTKANVALEAAQASFESTLTAYVDETRATVIKNETLVAALDAAEASYALTLTTYATKGEVATAKTEAIAASNGVATGLVQIESASRVNALNQVYGFWGVKIDVDGRVVGRIKLDGTGETSSFEISVDALRLSHPSKPQVYFRTVSRAVGSNAAWTYGSGSAFNFNESTPAVLYAPAHPFAVTNPLNVCAVREGVITVLVTAHIGTSGGFVTAYCRIDGGPPIVLGAFSPQANPVTMVRGADVFYGISSTSQIEFYCAPCNGVGTIVADSYDATTAHQVAIDVLSFNV